MPAVLCPHRHTALVSVASLATIMVACAGGSTEPKAVPTNGPLTATVGPAGGTVGRPDGNVMLTIPPNALGATTTITVTPRDADPSADHVVAGTAHEFGPDGTQFAAGVTLDLAYDLTKLPAGADPANLRVAKLAGSTLQIITEGATVDLAARRVRGTIRSFSSYAVVTDPCVVRTLDARTTGRITPDDCIHPATNRRSDYYGFTPAAGELVTISSSGLAGLIGIKESTSDPAEGTVWLSGNVGGELRLVADGSPLQVFVSGQTDTTVGAYAITRGTAPLVHSCATDTYLIPNVTFSQELSPSNSCTGNVRQSPVPQAVGKPLLLHYYGAKLVAGRTYTITLGGLAAPFDPALALWRGGQIVALNAPTGPPVESRSITFTPTATAYHFIEVSSGKFTDVTYTTWLTPSGSYTLGIR